MVKVLDKSKEAYFVKLTPNEYYFMVNVLHDADIRDEDFVFKKPAGKE